MGPESSSCVRPEMLSLSARSARGHATRYCPSRRCHVAFPRRKRPGLHCAGYGHKLVTMVMKKTISAGAFKAQCLKLMDQVNAQRAEVVITKRGKPVARLVPVETVPTSILGCMVGTAELLGDLLEPVVDPNDWEANR